MSQIDPTDDLPLYAASQKVYPQKVSGPFRQVKWFVLIACLAIYYALPFVRWYRGPHLPDQAVLVDFERRRFYFFWIELWPQEIYYFTGLLVIAAFALFMMNAVAGRIWCGYLCPQTVWSDLYLFVESKIEGDRRERMKRDEGPWNADKVWRKVLKHFVWIMIAWWTGGAWVLYFADAPTLVHDLATFKAPMVAYAWIGILTFTTYALAGFMREQVCLYMCPWPRIQAALTDKDALNVSYRYDRGEPRMSVKQAVKAKAANEPAGDCVDCNQCVAVCPTGVDIRLGSQLGCIQCGLCIDACDSVMRKIGRPERLIAYDTEDAIKARAEGCQPPPFRPIRPRTLIYVVLIALVGSLMLYKLVTRSFIEISAIHERSPLFVTMRDGAIRNAYTVRIANKRPEPRLVALTVQGGVGFTIEAVGTMNTTDWRPIVEVAPDTTLEVKVFVTAPKAALKPGEKSQLIWIKASDLYGGESASAKDHFFAP